MFTTVSTKALLESWLMLEFLSPGAEIDRDTCFSLNSSQYTRELKAHHKGSKILLGVFPLAAVQERLATLFTDPGFRETNTGSGYVAELTITRDGTLMADSIAFSSLPWAISQLERRTELANWDGQFRQFTADLAGELGEFFRADDGANFITRIEHANRHLIQRLGWQSICRPDLFFRPISKAGEAEPGLLNSFFATDLSRLLSSESNNIGPALQQYLRREPTQPRIDIRRNSDLIQQLTLASRLPEGAWPGPYALNLMQQVAVNYSVNELGDAGLFSVNGPPGTGKTTLLKDVFAAIIVGRAKKLVTYSTPANAFTPTGEQIRISDGYKPEWYRLAADLTDDAMIVASSNNTAVENLTKEIPLPNAAYLNGYDTYPPTVYFPEVGQLLTGNPSAWNGLALALGKGENKARFVTNWFDATDKEGGRRAGIQSLIKQTNYTLTDWQQAVADFNKAIAAFDELKQRAAQTEVMLRDSHLVKLLANNQFDMPLTHRTVAKEGAELQTKLADSHALLAENTMAFQWVQAQKPAFWHFWFGLKAARTYKAEVAAVAAERRTLQSRVAQLQTRQQINAHHAGLLAGLTRIRAGFGAATPDPIYWHSAATDNPSPAQEQAPWVTKPVKEASVAVFLAALRVQQVFVGLAQKPLLANINVLVGQLSGKVQLREAALSAAWNTLFLLTPVVSTTFAAAGRLFGGLGRETFGWLFIDEAGQAVPQAAVGTLWRCKRAILIGDPLQIKPVVSLPENVFGYVRTRKQIAPDWVSADQSVQTFGDAANHIGTQLPTGQWIGSPLKVHRRCLEPMFSLANGIAYDNLMQNANRTHQPADLGIGRSRFVHVTGLCTDKQWVPEQGQAALEIIRAYQAHRQSGEAFSLFVITPFRAVTTNFRQLLPPDLRAELTGRIGTVHTFQGKEADVVLFLLGGDANRLAALRWADDLNLLNVALTRAKQQFVAIGDRHLLTGTTHFSVMLAQLDEYERRQSGVKRSVQRG